MRALMQEFYLHKACCILALFLSLLFAFAFDMAIARKLNILFVFERIQKFTITLGSNYIFLQLLLGPEGGQSRSSPVR